MRISDLNSMNSWNTIGSLFGNNNTVASGSNNIFGSNNATTSNDFRANLLSLRRTADTLRATVGNLRGNNRNADSPFGITSAVSDDTDILNVSAINANRLRTANISDFSVEVIQVAQAQRNEGEALDSSALATDAGFTQGSHHLALNIGGRQFDFNFEVSATDTVRDVQQRIANAINTRNLGVTASVSADSAAGTSALVLESRETGVNREGQPNFTVSSLTGNAAAITGINNITQEAQNAQFRVNRGFTGALQTSRSNDVELGFGISAELREVGNVQISMGRDEEGQIDAFRDLVASFNNMMRAARNASPGESRIERELTTLARSSSASLNRLGISVNRDGLMQIDEDRLREAAERGDLERFAARDGNNSNFGFLNRLSQTAGNVARNPGAFINTDENVNSLFTANQLTRMHQLMNLGMLFDTRM